MVRTGGKRTEPPHPPSNLSSDERRNWEKEEWGVAEVNKEDKLREKTVYLMKGWLEPDKVKRALGKTHRRRMENMWKAGLRDGGVYIRRIKSRESVSLKKKTHLGTIREQREKCCTQLKLLDPHPLLLCLPASSRSNTFFLQKTQSRGREQSPWVLAPSDWKDADRVLLWSGLHCSSYGFKQGCCSVCWTWC